jgi:hypothetical protein
MRFALIAARTSLALRGLVLMLENAQCDQLITRKRTMKPVKGLKTASQKKTIAKSLADLPETIASPAKAESPPTITATSSSGRNGTRPVTIEAKIDVGFGNALYLRGEGRGLSWTQGVPLTCVDGKTWKWTGETTEQLKFKLLLNDQVWSQGEDLVAAPGQKLEISPAF